MSIILATEDDFCVAFYLKLSEVMIQSSSVAHIKPRNLSIAHAQFIPHGLV